LVVWRSVHSLQGIDPRQLLNEPMKIPMKLLCTMARLERKPSETN
jgi:hypothetical protein